MLKKEMRCERFFKSKDRMSDFGRSRHYKVKDVSDSASKVYPNIKRPLYANDLFLSADPGIPKKPAVLGFMCPGRYSAALADQLQACPSLQKIKLFAAQAVPLGRAFCGF